MTEKAFYTKYKKIISNFGYLSILEVVNLLIPLVTYPYLIRTLGAGIYGKVVFAQSITAFFSITINFGFNISGVKNVAENQNNRMKLSEIVSSVILLKFIIFIVCLFLLILFLSFKSNADKVLYLLTFGICIGEVFFPIWFFQGLEKMKYTTLINVFTRLLFTICIFQFIHTEDNYLGVPLFNSLGAITGGLLSFYILKKKENIYFFLPRLHTLKKYFTESIPFFTSRVSAVILTEANTLIVGTFISMKSVAYYDLARKIIKVFLIPNDIINSVFYPHIAKTKDSVLVRRVLLLRLAISLTLYAIIFFFSKYFILLLGGSEMLLSLPIVRLLGLNLIITAISYFLGGSVLVSFNKAKYFNLSVVYSLIVFLVFFFLLYTMDMVSITSIILLSLITEAIIASYRFYYCKKFQLL